MALSNREKQARWRERNIVTLTADAADIAEKLMAMEDQAKLRKLARFINDHLKHPDRTPEEQMIALGRAGVGGLNGPLSKTAALASLRATPDHSWRVEATTGDGRRWINGVRLESREEAQVYIDEHVRYDLEDDGYATAEILRSDDPPTNWITRKRKGGRSTLGFEHGTCTSLSWKPLSVVAHPQPA
jgi:hypothetical protein